MPKVNVVAERSKFRKRKQFPEESVDNYIAALRELASTCNFKTMEDEMIRDQFIEKTVHQRILERLLLKTYPLERAIEIARQLESGMKEPKLLSEFKVESQDYMENIQVVSSKNSLCQVTVTQKCFCCGLGVTLRKTLTVQLLMQYVVNATKRVFATKRITLKESAGLLAI